MRRQGSGTAGAEWLAGGGGGGGRLIGLPPMTLESGRRRGSGRWSISTRGGWRGGCGAIWGCEGEIETRGDEGDEEEGRKWVRLAPPRRARDRLALWVW